MERLIGLPALLVLIIAATVTIGLTYLAHRLVLRRCDTVQFSRHNDVAGFMITVVGTLYAVMLGFVTVAVWQQYDATRERASVETSAVANIWHAAAAFPQPARDAVQADMRTYTALMLRDEYPQMQAGQFREGAARARAVDAVFMHAMGRVTTLKPTAPSAINAQQVAFGQLNALHDSRNRRLASNDEALSWFHWFVLVLGAVVVIGLALLFGVENHQAHFAMTAAAALIIVSMFVLLFELQYPFQSDLRIRPDAWVALTEHIKYMDEMNREY
ncbi:MAG: hypothetical protein QOF71_3148 [Candidatus Eremiobacteraeota bacterium]|jgi:hypothetical protein|nr:hypothetical protein [Candidatus Eremiobacteraeota bacterium]